jgi:hypothetical protein
MITNFKIFEHLNFLPKVDDYILINIKTKELPIFFNEFINNTIGRVSEIFKGNSSQLVVKYLNIPDNCRDFFENDGNKIMNTRDIVCWSEKKEDIEIYINTNKYNI